MDIIQVPVSPGEVLDKITILEIKSERISDAGKVANVKRELGLLSTSWLEAVDQDDTIRRIHAELKTINEALWKIEDDIRDRSAPASLTRCLLSWHEVFMSPMTSVRTPKRS